MTDNLLLKIHEELVEIRKLLAERPKSAPAASTSSRASSGSTSSRSGSDEPIPQPTEIVANPGDVQIHFGKNQGVPLANLNERSLSWYAQEQAPRLDSSGKPFPPRPQDVALRNAARTLWHQNKGTLAGRQASPAPAREPATTSGGGASVDEEVPFSRFEPLFP